MQGRLQKAGQVLNLYKKMGETPRERLERLRKERWEFENETLSYAGRLDPMAEGVLLALVGSANLRREQYLDLPKEYTLDVLFGFATDTYDVLGKVMEKGDASEVSQKELLEVLQDFEGEVSQEYPPYSSKVVEGKSLFEWARTNALGTLILPRRVVTIGNIELRGMYRLPEGDLLNYIENNVRKVQGDFRQEECLRLWQRELRLGGERLFPCATVHFPCSSGTYARSLAQGLGEKLGVPALALHILRTRVGEYSMDESLR